MTNDEIEKLADKIEFIYWNFKEGQEAWYRVAKHVSVLILDARLEELDKIKDYDWNISRLIQNRIDDLTKKKEALEC